MKIRLLSACLIVGCGITYSFAQSDKPHATRDNGTWMFLDSADMPTQKHHTNHEAMLKKYIDGYNLSVIKAIDEVQSHAMDGGGYFTGMTATPTESPIGYELKLFDKPLLAPPRPTSYCSGSTYGVFIEALNRIFPDGGSKISDDRYESLRMQEPDGGRREDRIKFWGKWNDDGWGTQYALVQYSGMGEEIPPQRARPGDFMNIAWKSGNGHSVVFLGWIMRENQLWLLYWASQKSTNGFGDVVLWPLSNVQSVKTVRLNQPEKVFSFDVNRQVERDIPGDKIQPPAR
jgi:hypothetical protein